MIGTEKSYLHGYTPTVSVMMGICTAWRAACCATCSRETFPTCFVPGNCTPPRPSWEAWRTRCFTTSGSTLHLLRDGLRGHALRAPGGHPLELEPAFLHSPVLPGGRTGSHGGRGKGDSFRETRRTVIRATCGSTLPCNRRKASPPYRPARSRSACCSAGTVPAHLLRPGFPVFREGNKGTSGISPPRCGGGCPFPSAPSIRTGVSRPWRNCRTCYPDNVIHGYLPPPQSRGRICSVVKFFFSPQ